MRAISLVDVEIDNEDACDAAVAAQATRGHHHVVERAEALCGVGEGVVCAAAKVGGRTVAECGVRRRNGGAHAAQPALHQPGRPRKAKGLQLAVGHLPALHPVDVLGVVREQQVVVGGRIGLQ